MRIFYKELYEQEAKRANQIAIAFWITNSIWLCIYFITLNIVG